MPKLTSIQAVLLLSCAWSLLVSAQDLSDLTLDFLAVNLGFFDNLRQTQTGASDNLRVQFKQISVDVPALSPAPVYYSELVVEGEVQNMLLGAVNELPDETVEVKLYNFTNACLFKSLGDCLHRPGEFDVSTLYDLKRGDLSGGNCTAIYKRLDRAVYVGAFPDCTNIIEGNNPIEADTFTCNRASIIFPPTVFGFSKTPYIFDRTGDRFPTVGFPDTFNRVCGQPGQVSRRYK